MTTEEPPELILIETSGSCHPLPLVEYFHDHAHFKLTGIFTLIDAAMIDQDFSLGQNITQQIRKNAEKQIRDVVNLLVEQIMFCNHLLITKADKLREGDLTKMAHNIHQFNPFVAVTAVPWGRLAIRAHSRPACL